MKRVNTGSKTKSDPDSRINKALRKWNCKCSSAYEFGKQAGMLSGLAGLFGRGVKAAPAAISKSVSAKRPALDISKVHPSVIGPLAAERKIPLISHPDLVKKIDAWAARADRRPNVPPNSRLRMPRPGDSPYLPPRFGQTDLESDALQPAIRRWQNAVDSRAGNSTSDQFWRGEWSGLPEPEPITDARTWGALKGILPGGRRSAAG